MSSAREVYEQIKAERLKAQSKPRVEHLKAKLASVDLEKQRKVLRQAEAKLAEEEDRQISAAEHNQRVLHAMRQRQAPSIQDLRQFAIDHWMEAKLFAEAQERRHRAALDEYLELW
jgi:hypothetical protein